MEYKYIFSIQNNKNNFQKCTRLFLIVFSKDRTINRQDSIPTDVLHDGLYSADQSKLFQVYQILVQHNSSE